MFMKKTGSGFFDLPEINVPKRPPPSASTVIASSKSYGS